MRRRQLLQAGLALPFMGSGIRAAEPHYSVKLLDGGWLGQRRAAGLHVELDDGWKTYWRMPGNAGIPPLFDWQGSDNAAAIQVLFPLPRRYTDTSGDTVGYMKQVILPILIEPANATKPIELKLDLFFAVCEDICIPARTKTNLTLDVGSKGDETHRFQEWIARVPVPATEPLPVSASTLAMEGERPVLILSLAQPVTDIFVETDGEAYFRKPDFAADGLSARLVIDNVTEGENLVGKTLNLTIDRDGAGLEQAITLA
jgi:DsbC/DsbD-like thiol-disulfide interchange protein